MSAAALSPPLRDRLLGLVVQFVVLQDEHLGVVADGRGGLIDHHSLLAHEVLRRHVGKGSNDSRRDQPEGDQGQGHFGS